MGVGAGSVTWIKQAEFACESDVGDLLKEMAKWVTAHINMQIINISVNPMADEDGVLFGYINYCEGIIYREGDLQEKNKLGVGPNKP